MSGENRRAFTALFFGQRRTGTLNKLNKLYYGDNLSVLRKEIASESVDLVYLDPPFNSQANYNVLFKSTSGEQSHAQIEAFEDTWHWGDQAEQAFDEVMHGPNSDAAELLRSLRAFLKENDMMAYLTMMAVRLIELHRVFKETGSIYLHCDPTASHYLKIFMDAIFGAEMFRNEIAWKRTTTHSDSKTWSRVADVIFFYAKGAHFTWNTPREPHSEEYLESKYRYDDGDGRVYRLDNMTSPNPRRNMMYEWRGFPYPPKGWRYSLETMKKARSPRVASGTRHIKIIVWILRSGRSSSDTLTKCRVGLWELFGRTYRPLTLRLRSGLDIPLKSLRHCLNESLTPALTRATSCSIRFAVAARLYTRRRSSSVNGLASISRILRSR